MSNDPAGIPDMPANGYSWNKPVNEQSDMGTNIEIVWTDFPEQDYLRKGFGHGVELTYGDGADRHVIGFIDGFGWLHGLSNQAIVFVRSKDSSIWKNISESYQNVIRDMKEAARIVVSTKQFTGCLKGNIYSFVNG